jgi:hypothetical protein
LHLLVLQSCVQVHRSYPCPHKLQMLRATSRSEIKQHRYIINLYKFFFTNRKLVSAV